MKSHCSLDPREFVLSPINHCKIMSQNLSNKHSCPLLFNSLGYICCGERGYIPFTFDWKQWVGLALTSFTYYFTYNQLASMAKPSYAAGGDLMDGGFDMSTGGLCGCMHDVIYITGFVQLGSIISGKFWYTYLVIPGYAAYKCFGLMKGFLPNNSEEPEEDEKTRKKREKLEKKASRGKTRTR